MTEYKDLPKDIQVLVEDYATSGEYAAEIFSTIQTLCPNKGMSLYALTEVHVEWKHQELLAKEALNRKGYDDDELLRLTYAYYQETK